MTPALALAGGLVLSATVIALAVGIQVWFPYLILTTARLGGTQGRRRQMTLERRVREAFAAYRGLGRDLIDEMLLQRLEMRTALMAAEETLALCAGKVPAYVDDRRVETLAIVRNVLKQGDA